MLNSTEINTTNPVNSPIPTIKKEAAKKNRLPMYAVLALVIITSIAGIGISLRQYFVRDTVAPTAPEQSQANIDKIQDCSLSFEVAPLETKISCIKLSYRDELSNRHGDYELVEEETNFKPGDIVVYSFTVNNAGDGVTILTATDTLDVTGSEYEFLDSNCGADVYQNGSLTCVSDSLLPGESQTFTFRIQLSDEIDEALTIVNSVEVTDGKLIEECNINIIIDIEVIEAECNEACTVNSDCVKEGQSCTDNLCRLDANPESKTCEEEVISYCGDYCELNEDCIGEGQICSDNECRLEVNPTSETCEEEVTAQCGETCELNSECIVEGQVCFEDQCRLEENLTSETCEEKIVANCGESCESNSDCINSDHICYFDECRLADYPDSQECKIPEVTPTPSVIPTPAVGCNEDCLTNRDCSNNDHICYEGDCRLADYPASTSCTIPVGPSQPKMPEELPQSGSDDLINWIKAGIGILGAGALLLLL